MKSELLPQEEGKTLWRPTPYRRHTEGSLMQSLRGHQVPETTFNISGETDGNLLKITMKYWNERDQIESPIKGLANFDQSKATFSVMGVTAAVAFEKWLIDNGLKLSPPTR